MVSRRRSSSTLAVFVCKLYLSSLLKLKLKTLASLPLTTSFQIAPKSNPISDGGSVIYRERGTVESKSEIAFVDQKRINDILDKQFEQSSPSTSHAINDKERTSSSLLSATKDHRDSRSTSAPIYKNSNASDGNKFFCKVDDDYIQDDFNLCGLGSQVPYYNYALDLILDVESSHGDMFTEEQNKLIESAAEMLYGLIHAQYILTSKGMNDCYASVSDSKSATLDDLESHTSPSFVLELVTTTCNVTRSGKVSSNETVETNDLEAEFAVLEMSDFSMLNVPSPSAVKCVYVIIL
ncbi:hypothetical protein RJT34_32228 [Clitoria ternatea]|uniref:Casein kinase II subunit beta n=1 Tax=Clitoria ternatea TaxID=43366 RepID=A0AAN9EX16_CLITE